FAVSRFGRFAFDCDQLRPRGSIKAPSSRGAMPYRKSLERRSSSERSWRRAALPIVGGSAADAPTAVQDGMPGGPRISMPYSAAVAANRSRLGGSVAGGGIVRLGAGSDKVRMK